MRVPYEKDGKFWCRKCYTYRGPEDFQPSFLRERKRLCRRCSNSARITSKKRSLAALILTRITQREHKAGAPPHDLQLADIEQLLLLNRDKIGDKGSNLTVVRRDMSMPLSSENALVTTIDEARRRRRRWNSIL